MANLRLLMAQDLRDGLRSRRQLLVRALMPVALLVVLGGAVLAVSPGGATAGLDPYVVAVEGDWEGASRTLEGFGSGALVFVQTSDAALAAVGSADVGLRVPEALDELVAQGEPTTVEVVELAIDESSRAATIQLRNAAASAHLSQVLGSDADLDSLFDFAVISTERSQRGSLALVAELVPALLCLQAAILVGTVANRIAGRRTAGLLASQLVLPVRRLDLAMGKALAELGVGLVASVAVLVPALVVGVYAAASGGPGPAVVALVAIPAVALVLRALATTVGLTVALRARSAEQVTLASGSALVVASVVVTMVAIGGTGRPQVLSLVPVAGPVSELRMLLLGAPRPAALAISLVVSAAAVWLVVRLAARSLDSERLTERM